MASATLTKPAKGGRNTNLGCQVVDVDWEQHLLNEVNRVREIEGVQALERCQPLVDAAVGHTRWMIDTDTFSHAGEGGSSPSDRAAAAGYSGGAGENIAAGYRTVAHVMEGWMNSPGHRANILGRSYIVIGTARLAATSGRYPWGHHWTQNFGSQPCDATTLPGDSD